MIIRTAANEVEIEQSIELYWANEPPHDPADKASALAHWLAIYATCPEGFWIAQDEESKQIVGVAAAIRRPPQWVLANFFVLPTYHGQGIGRRLLSEAVATREGCDRFLVHASLHPAAQSLYMQFGMYPLPYSIVFRGSPKNQLLLPSVLATEERHVGDMPATLNAFDQETLGFTRAEDHERWDEQGKYFVAKAASEVIAYFRVSPQRLIGPLVVSDINWTNAVLDLAIRKQWEFSPGEQELFVPGANKAALAYLLAHDYHYAELDLLMSSHPMPGLAQVLFRDTDFL